MRIVSLCPSITESLVALGLRDDLAGVTRYCIHPREALAGIPRVGGTKNPDVPGILALAPDLVFVNAEENRRQDVEALAARTPVDVSHPRSAEEVPGLLRRFGARCGRRAEAEALAARIEARLDARGHPSDGFRYVVLIWKDPWMSTGGGTYVDGLLRGAGGVPAIAREKGPDYPVVTEEEIVSALPDLLVLPDEPYRFGAADRDFWSVRLPGAEIRCVPGDDLTWHGVRTLRGLDLCDDLARSLPARVSRAAGGGPGTPP